MMRQKQRRGDMKRLKYHEREGKVIFRGFTLIERVSR